MLESTQEKTTLEKTVALEILNSVAEALFSPEIIPDELVKRILYCFNHEIKQMMAAKPSEGLTNIFQQLSVSIPSMFSEVTEFSAFPLSVSESTIRRLGLIAEALENTSQCSESVNSMKGSIKVVTAFLVAQESNPLTLENLLDGRVSNSIAESLSDYMGFMSEFSDIATPDFHGTYFSRKPLKGKQRSIQLKIIPVKDKSHYLVEELYHDKNDNSAAESVVKQAGKAVRHYGFAVFTYHDSLMIFMEHGESTGFTYLCLDTGGADVDNVNRSQLCLLKIRESGVEAKQNWGNFSLSNVVELERNIYAFEKGGELLSFFKGFDDKSDTAHTRLSKRRFNKVRSAAVAESIKGVYTVSNIEDKTKLSEQLFKEVSADFNDLDRVFELIDQGASLNYVDPKSLTTPMHHLSVWNVEVVEEALKRSQDDYNFLAKDRKGNLASAWAYMNNHQSGVWKLLMEKEAEAIHSEKASRQNEGPVDPSM